MRITDIEVKNLRFDYPDSGGFVYGGGRVNARVTSLVFVHSDDGQRGIGASYSHPDLVKLIVEQHLRPHLIGRDPVEVESLWKLMYDLTRWYGRKGVAVSALGGVDIALWDLKGKAAGEPLYRLLGGSTPRVKAYASGLFWADDVAALAAEAKRHVSHGFRGVKTRLGRNAEYDHAALHAIRNAVGEDVNIMVDGSHRYNQETAAQMVRELERVRAFWFEEPFPPEALDDFVQFRPTSEVPLAAGENEFGFQGFRELLRAGALDIVQPDCCRAGGITECKRIAHEADAHGIAVATHTWSDAVALIANAHVIASSPNGITVEIDQSGNPFVDALLTEPLVIDDGWLHLSDAPGLGIELDETTLERLSVGDALMQDGNYSDMIFGAEYFESPPPYDPVPNSR